VALRQCFQDPLAVLALLKTSQMFLSLKALRISSLEMMLKGAHG
jgi:hypothetical protein